MPGNSLGRTTVGLNARTQAFNRDMIRASRLMRRFGREARSAAASAGRIVTGLAFGSGALGATIKLLSDSATSLRELSIASGIAVPRLQELQRVFEADGLSAQGFEKAIRRLQRSIGDAARGEIEYLESFEQFGISLRNAAGEVRSTEAVLTDVIDVLAELPPALQASVGNDFFGRGFQQMSTSFARLGNNADAFNQELERQRDLLPSLTGDAAIQLKAVNQAFTDAGNAAQTYGQLLVASIGPELIAGIEGALRAIKDNSSQITSALQTVARNVDLLIGAGLLIVFRRFAFAIAVAQGNLIKFAFTAATTAGAGGLAALGKSMRTLGASTVLLGKQVLIVAAGFTTLLYAANLVNNALQGEGLASIGNAFDDTIAQITRGYREFTSIFDGGGSDIPVIQIQAEIDDEPIRQVQEQVKELTSQVNVVKVEAETFGLADQVRQLEQQRSLLLASGDEAVRLAARQQYLAQVNSELAQAYDQLERAQQQLADGGPNLDVDQAARYRDEIDTLVDRIQYLNGVKIDPEFNSNVIDQISNLNQQIAEISGRRQAEISIDMTVDFGANLDQAREQLEAELRLLQQAASGHISFGIAEQMQQEVNTALGELNRIQARIRNNERLLNLMPDITEAAKLNAELVRLRSLAATIEFNIKNPEVLQSAAQDVIRLKDEIAALQRQQEFARSAANSFTNALGGIITGTQSGSEAVKSFISSLANLVLQYTVLIPLAQSLAGAIGGFGIGGGGAIPGFASGGFGRGLALVGEGGPELVDFGSGSRVYTNDQLADAVGNGGQNLVVNNNISIQSSDGPGVRAALAEALPLIVDASTNKIMSESSRPGAVRQVLRGY